MKDKIYRIYNKLSNYLASLVIAGSIVLPVFKLLITLVSLSMRGIVPKGYNTFTLIECLILFIGGIKLNDVYYKNKE